MEVFKELYIPEYGIIEVGENGTIIGKKGVMKPNNQNSKKYYRVHLGNHMYAVHRLVAQAFIENPLQLPQVNHKDGNKSNNNANNLEWCTNQFNKTHAVENCLIHSKVSPKIADQIRRMYETHRYTYEDLGAIFNLSYSMVGYIVRRDSWNLRSAE